MSIDLRPLITPSFWFALSPQPPVALVSKIAFAVLVAFVVASLVLRVLRRRTEDKLKRVLLARTASMLVWMGCLGLVLAFCRFEQISFFGARFWSFFWLVGLIIWIVSVVRFARKDMPRMRGENARVKENAKYLPKGNR